MYVAHRAGPEGTWVTPGRPVSSGPGFDDKPELAVDAVHDRIYVVWQRLEDIETSHSTDGTRWSRASRASRNLAGPAFPSVSVGLAGTVFVAWADLDAGVIRLTRSTDGGARFVPERVVARTNTVSSCPRQAGVPIPAQPRRCVVTIPHLLTFGDRLYLVYDAGNLRRGRDVYVAAFAPDLRPVLRPTRVNPPDGFLVSDQFLAAVALDPSSGRLWVCFYDTRADPTRRKTRYVCTFSDDRGAHWRPSIPVATVRSDETQPGADAFEYGEYTGLVVAGGVAHPIWTDSRDLSTEAEEIYTASVRAP